MFHASVPAADPLTQKAILAMHQAREKYLEKGYDKNSLSAVSFLGKKGMQTTTTDTMPGKSIPS